MSRLRLVPSVFLIVVLAACSSSSPDPDKAETPTTNGTNPAQIMPSNIVAAASSAPQVASAAGGATSAMMGNVVAPTIVGSNDPMGTAPKPDTGTVAITGPTAGSMVNAPAEQPISEKGAFRLLQQATFGPTEAGITEAMQQGPKRWLAAQFAMPTSTYGYRDRDAIHKWASKDTGFCDQYPEGSVARNNCWRDWYSTDLIKLDFFKQASLGTDQLRQRVGFALSQITVVSGVEVQALYGMADYYQMLRDKAFTNYRDVLLSVAMHPVMGDYLDMVNNDATDPNENFAREMLQLFSIGTCDLNEDGTLKDGKCNATYNNDMVRQYAYALTGWTYPAGGVNPWCTPKCDWKNPSYLKGSMVPVAEQHDKQARGLLAGNNLAAGHSPMQAMNAVIDSLMAHPNIAPFISKQLIQFLVTSNPSPAYVARVSSAFKSGKFDTFGTGQKGDMKATIAAILLDTEARNDASAQTATMGKLREPIIMMVSAVRALNGYTDGERMGAYGWGSSLSQPLFNSPSVFNYYTPDYPLAGQPGLVAPQFQLMNANTSLNWSNFSNDIVYWWYNKGEGLAPKTDMLGSTGSKVSYASWEKDAEDSAKLIDRLDKLFTGGALGTAGKAAIASALAAYTSQDTWLTDANNASSWQRERVRTAAYLLIASPHFQVQR
jgi:uncharacterized protein (DUF1800 family)